ncbi:MAG: DUF4810 domain-containing protein [Idiomarina sp.]|nr:DUF4810 domain-containing protein [Idiomarina sp.]
MRARFSLLIVAAASVLAACETTPSQARYWTMYEEGLVRYYEDPAASAFFYDRLVRAIQEAEANNIQVPPGLYADLGTLWFEQQNYVEAKRWYQKEYEAWPESRPLMSTLIQTLERWIGEPEDTES